MDLRLGSLFLFKPPQEQFKIKINLEEGIHVQVRGPRWIRFFASNYNFAGVTNEFCMKLLPVILYL